MKTKKLFSLVLLGLLCSIGNVWADVDLTTGASYDFTTITTDAFSGVGTNYWKADGETPTYYGNGSNFKPTSATAFMLNSTDEIEGFEGLKLITGSSSGRARIYVNGNGLYFNSTDAKLVFPSLVAGQEISIQYANVSSDEANFTATNASVTQNTTTHVATLKVTADGDVTLTYSSKKFYIHTITIAAVDNRDPSSIAFTSTSGSADMAENLSFTLPALTKIPSGASVTYSSSVPAVASVNETTGAVTLKKTGTTVITASFAGDEDYKPSSGTYTLTVTNSAEATIYSWESTGATTSNEVGGTISETTAGSLGGNTILTIGLSSSPTLTLNTAVKEGSVIKVTAFRNKDSQKNSGFKATFDKGGSVASSSGTEFVNVGYSSDANYGTEPNTIEFIVPAAADGSTVLSLTRSHTQTNLFITKLEIVSYSQEMSIGSATWATFSSASEVAIPDGVTAYYAKQVNGNTVTLKEITTGIIPANTGVVLNGDEGDYTAYFTSTGATLGETNLLKPNISAYALPATTVVAETTYYNYTLAYEGGSPVFKHSTGSGNLAAGKAYLQTTINAVAGAPSIIRIVDEEENATVIENIESSNQAVKFFENGQIFIRKDGVVYDTMGRVIR